MSDSDFVLWFFNFKDEFTFFVSKETKSSLVHSNPPLQMMVSHIVLKSRAHDKKRECNRVYSVDVISLVPAEILARGSMAIKSYHKALEQGMTRVVRVPIMIIGQERSGKTSLKKSLKGQLFNPGEESTDLIERDPSYFSVTTELWKAGETDTEPHSDVNVSFHNRVPRIIAADLRGVKNDPANHSPSSESIIFSNWGTTENVKGKGYIPDKVKEKKGRDTLQHLEDPASQTTRLKRAVS